MTSVDAVEDEALVAIEGLIENFRGSKSAIAVLVKTVVAVAVDIDLPETGTMYVLVAVSVMVTPDFCEANYRLLHNNKPGSYAHGMMMVASFSLNRSSYPPSP